MGTTSTGAARPQASRKLASFVVVVDGRVIFASDMLAAAAAFRDGHGSGDVYEIVTTGGPVDE